MCLVVESGDRRRELWSEKKEMFFMKEKKIFKNIVKVFLVLMVGLTGCMNVGVFTCFAEELPEVTVDNLLPASYYGEGIDEDACYRITKIDGLSDTAKVTITTDNPDVAGIYYVHSTVSSNKFSTDDEFSNVECVYVDGINMVNGNEFKFKPVEYDADGEYTAEYKKYCENLGKGTWYTELGIEARRIGTAVITVTVDN